MATWPIQYNNIATGVNSVGPLPSFLQWGTDGILTNVIVKNIRASQIIEEYKIEQGAGLTAKQVLINDGDEVEFSVVADGNITNWPMAGGVVTLVNPQPNTPILENYQVINNNYTVSRKVEGERTILAKKYLLITPTQM
jgi:hypothetical protein